MRTAFLTGGTGFVGWHVAKELLSQGWTVRALARGGAERSTGLETLPVEVVPGDLSDERGLARAIAGAAAVVHAAGRVKARSLADYRAANVSGTERLLRAARESAPESVFVYVSSQAAAGPALGGRPVTESDPPRPVSWYGVSKLEGEQAVARQWRGPWVVLRPGVLYGPRDRGLLTLFRMATRGWLPVPGGLRRVQLAAVEEAAAGIARAASRPDLASRTGFLCDPRPVRLDELASRVAASAGGRVRLLRVPDAAVRLAGVLETLREAVTGESRPFNADKAREMLAGDWLCDPEPIRRDLGLLEPPPLDEGLRRTFEWYRREGWV